MSIFSFHPVKNMTTGEGGAITTNNEKLYKKYGINEEEINFINSLIRPIEKHYD
jgi:hypothetical protein